MSQYPHVSAVTAEVRNAMHAWVTDLLSQAGLKLPVYGSTGQHGLILLPYQMVMESQPGVPQVSLMPTAKESRSESIPRAWRVMARGMTEVLVEQFPKRAPKAPGIGPLEPAPTIDALPEPLKAWYRKHEDWRVNDKHGRLPQISWRQPFSLVVRFAALVQDPKNDLQQLQALAVIAAGIRQERYFRCTLPPPDHGAVLDELIDAFAASAQGDLNEELTAAAEASRSDGQLAVGLFPHHDLTDQDLALVMQALQLPMQAALVFGARMSLGGGPVLLPGAMPHLGSVDKAEA